MTIEIQRTPLMYEAHLDGEKVGSLAVSRHGDVITAIHTEVAPEVEGKGVGSTLAQTLFEDARSSGRKVEVQCRFVAKWLRGHPEYLDLVVTSRARN
ncbi:MAG TPA: GNAT family N-acetyltransferase [Jiangellaceae bacterium]|nr:GNAT family N-acetyltransferase [Jiangellaceae bacterium]